MKYILKGKEPVEEPDVIKWAEWFAPENTRVAKSESKGIRVSTVFLGIDHSFTDNSAPILFETMVFGGEFDEDQDRYCTWEQAEAGHKAMCDKVFNED